jgi:hypothetical protein
LRALAQHGQLELAESSFHAKEHSIVDLPRIVHASLVDQQTSNEAANLEQRMPVAAIAREA